MSKKLFSKFFVFLLVVGLLFAVAPTKQAQAATSVSTAAELTAAIAGTETDITVTANISVGSVTGHAFTIPSGRIITLDLNGYEISAETSNGGVFYNLGSLTVVDNSSAKGGKITNTNTTQTTLGDSAKSAISNNGQLTVNAGVTVAGPADGHGSYGMANFNPAYGIDNLNGGDVTINGATISGAYGLRNFANANDMTITIIDGTITGKTGIAMQSFGTNVGTLIISGNTTITAEKSAIYAAGVTQYNQIVINGGTFSGESEYGTVCVVDGSLTINGGTFTGRNYTYSLNNYYAVGNVTAGTFNGNIYGGSGDGKTTFAPSAGKQIIVYGAIEGIVDGAGNVVLNPAVHNVTQNTYFSTIQAAINAAADGNTIEVAAGSYAESIDINKSINLIGAGRDLVTLTGTGTGENAVIDISVSNVTVQGFKIVAIDRKTVRITAATTNVQIKDNRLVGAANPTLANNFTLLETSGNQAGHLITDNIFEANFTSQVVYYNPTTNGITFTGNTFLGTTKPGGVGFVLDSLLGTYDISTNNFTGLGGNPYAMMGLPGLTPTAMNTVYGNNTFPTGYAVVGTDIMLPPTKMLMDPATFATTDTCIGTHEVFVKVQAVTNMVSYDLDLTYDSSLITVTNVENVSPIVGTTIPGYSWADGVINFGWYNPSGGGTPPTYTGDYSLIKITFQSKGLAGTSAFTILPSSQLEEWPNAFGIPFEVTGGASVSFGSIVTNTSQTKSYCDLAVAVAEAAGGNTLRVDANITSNVSITVDKALTLNTNGLTISRTIATTPNNSFAVVPGGNLTITGGGTITATSGTAVRITGDATTLAKVTLVDATLYAPSFSVAILGNRTYDTHATPYLSQFVMTGGKTNETVILEGNGAEADISGGTLTGFAPIMGNGTVDAVNNKNEGGTKITISGTAMVNGNTNIAIFHPQDGLLTINGGTIIGTNGIEMDAGDLVITGGTIKGTGACLATPVETPEDGSTDTGDAILILHQPGYTPGDQMHVTISGTPTIESTNCYALRELDFGGANSDLALATISSGHFTGGTLGAVYFATNNATNLELVGGDYSADPIAFVYDPYGTYKNAARWYIAPLPVLSSTTFDDQVTLGVATTFSLTVNPSVPGAFSMVFTGYPSETEITYGETTYYCVGSPCVITVPVTLTGTAPETLAFGITVATGGSETPATSYAVAATLHAPAPDYGTAGRDLDTLTATVPVTPGFSVSGTVTMQGRTTRAGVPVYLTWNNTLGVTYGPHMDTDEQAVNFRLTVNYGGTYTITTLQPRYLNITADLLKQVTLTGNKTINPLWLRAGNAWWQPSTGVYDNKIDGADAQKVFTTWGTAGGTDTLENSGDVNFDGTVSIKDLTLVGGNMDLQSESSGLIEGFIYAYPDWQP